MGNQQYVSKSGLLRKQIDIFILDFWKSMQHPQIKFMFVSAFQIKKDCPTINLNSSSIFLRKILIH